MQSIYLKKNSRSSSYSAKNETSLSINTLGSFFTDDVTGYISSWLDFAMDDTQRSTGSNSSGLDKEGDFIILGDLLHEDDEIRTDTLTIHKDDFIKMLLRWEELYKQQPDEILITQDDQGKISMVGKFNDGREI